MFASSLFEQSPLYFLLWALAIVLATTVHEFSHALSGFLQGDHTAEDAGRLTLNPLAHIDWFGFIAFLLIGFGWAKPTPFNPYNLKYKRFGPALVALAGPISNLLFAVIIAIALRALNSIAPLAPDNLMVVFFFFIIEVNVILAIFNLLPIPPLDGSRILYTFLIDKRPDIIMTIERYSIFILIGILIFFSGPISRIINATINIIYAIIL